MPFRRVVEGLFVEELLDPPVGELAELMRRFGAYIVVGIEALGEPDRLAALLRGCMQSAGEVFPGQRVAVVVVDRTFTANSMDTETFETAVETAREVLAGFRPSQRDRLWVVVTPLEGYAGDLSVDRGSALRMIYDELGDATGVELLVLLRGDLQIEAGPVLEAFARAEQHRIFEAQGRPCLMLPRQVRSFLDGCLERLLLGPLCSLLGRGVPGLLAPERALSGRIVTYERHRAWRPGASMHADLLSAVDTLADAESVVYELALGPAPGPPRDQAQLDENTVACIETLLQCLRSWEQEAHMLSRLAAGELALDPVRLWEPESTRIPWSDRAMGLPWDPSSKAHLLVSAWPSYRGEVSAVLGPHESDPLAFGFRELEQALDAPGHRSIAFPAIDEKRWLNALEQAVRYVLSEGDLAVAARALGFLHLTLASNLAHGLPSDPSGAISAQDSQALDAHSAHLSAALAARRHRLLPRHF